MAAVRKKPSKRKKLAAKTAKRKVKPQVDEKEKARIAASLKLMEGRTTTYTEALGNEIAAVVSRETLPLHELCDLHEHWPTTLHIRLWRTRYPEFGASMDAAFADRADVLMSEAEKKTDALNVKGKYGNALGQKQRMSNRMAQLWAQRLSPAWATKTAHEVTGPGGKEAIPVNFSNMTVEELRDMRELHAKAMRPKPSE